MSDINHKDLHDMIRDNGYNNAIIDVLKLIPIADHDLYVKVVDLYKREKGKVLVNEEYQPKFA